MQISKEKIASLFTNYPYIKLAYLIGSYAKGLPRADSDLDIALVVEKEDVENINYSEIYNKISKIIKHPNLDIRIVVENKTDPLYLFEIAKGKLLYVKEEEKRVEFEKKAMLMYYDSQHLRDIFNKYIDKRIEKGSYGK